MRRIVVITLTALGLSACASSGAVPRPFPVPGSAGPDRGAAAGRPADTYAITGTALALRGAPYRNGGADPGGFDCSGFVWYVFGQHGVRLPRTVGEQFGSGTGIDRSGIDVGDLVFFTTTAPGASHVGIVIGGDQFVHAPSSRGEVRVERLSSSYWSSRYVGARRIR